MTVLPPDLVSNRQRRIRVDVVSLGSFVEQVRRELGFPEESVAVQLVSDAVMKRLNWRFRKKHGSTDVLSFPAQLQSDGVRSRRRRRATETDYVGDIAISPAMARRNARRDARTLLEELRILVLHGMIHLAGYDHETDQGQMERVEKKLRRRLGLISR
jgi:probable rRNA maturation factor